MWYQKQTLHMVSRRKQNQKQIDTRLKGRISEQVLGNNRTQIEVKNTMGVKRRA